MLSWSASVVTKSKAPTLMLKRLGVDARMKSSIAAMSGHQLTFGGSTEPSSSPNKATNPVPDFNDIRNAYDTKTTQELVRAWACFRISRVAILVNNAEPLLTISRKILGGTITDYVLKATLFGHFCAGEDLKRIRPVLHQLNDVGIGSILDYAAENEGSPEPAKVHGTEVAPGSLRRVREYDYESEVQCDKHIEVFKKCINDVAALGFGKDGYAAIKVTALGNPKLLARMSQAIVEAQRLFEQFDLDNDGTVSREDFEKGYQ
jgi:proline dehydrogenase